MALFARPLPIQLLTVVLTGVLTASASAQTVHLTFDGDSADDFLGASVRGTGDVSGDGVPDLIVGAPGDNGSGSAWVLSGVDGAVLYQFQGGAPDDKCGLAVAGAGDVNADGAADLIVGSPGADPNGSGSGLARVFSGLDGALLYTFTGDDPGDGFGGSVGGAGDVNGDGFADLVVGAAFDDDNGANAGRVTVFSGLNGGVLHVFDGDAAGDVLGVVVDSAGDVNGDGFDDVLAGAPFDDDNGLSSGSARVFSGLDGSTLYTFLGDDKGDQFGNAVAGVGDVNGDGFDDVIVAARNAGVGGVGAGRAQVFSGLDGAVLHTFDGQGPGLHLGRAVGAAGDVDGDGFADLIVGETVDDGGSGTKGSVRVFSGADGALLHVLSWHTPGDSFGRAVDGVGDVDGDGFDDLVIGDSHDFANGPNGGSAIVFSGHALVGTTYCSPAVPNSTGAPAVMETLGSDVVADNLLFLTASGMPLNKFGYFFTSQTQGFVQGPGMSQGNLCLGGTIGRFVSLIQNSSSTGSFMVQIDLTDIPKPAKSQVQAGESWNFQAWYRDSNPGPTSNFTDAVSVTFQ